MIISGSHGFRGSRRFNINSRAPSGVCGWYSRGRGGLCFVGEADPLGDGPVDALLVPVDSRLALGGLDHGLQDYLPARLCVGRSRLGLSEALDVLTLRAALSELVLSQRLESDIQPPGVARQGISGLLVLLDAVPKVDGLRRVSASEVPWGHSDPGQDLLVPSLLEAPGVEAPGLHDLAVLGEDSVGVGELVVAEEGARQHAGAHVAAAVVLRALRILLEEDLLAEAVEGHVELPPP